MFTYYDKNGIESAINLKHISSYQVLPKNGILEEGKFVMDHIQISLENGDIAHIPYEYFEKLKHALG